MPLKELDHHFIVDFDGSLKVDQGIDPNTAIKYILNLQKLMNMAFKNDWLVKNPFNNFKCSTKKVKRVLLTEKVLLSLHDKELSIQHLEDVRDIFLFYCYTGYAFVDVDKLKPSDVALGIDGGKWIFTNRKKPGTTSNDLFCLWHKRSLSIHIPYQKENCSQSGATKK